MPWLLQRLQHGESPGAYSWVDEDHTPGPGEVVTDTDPKGRVWDETSKTLRLPTPLEEQAQSTAELQAAKARKRDELVADADEAYQREIPSFAGVVVAAKFVPPNNTQYLNARELTVFNVINAGYAKLNLLLDQVDAATTVEQVEAIVW